MSQSVSLAFLVLGGDLAAMGIYQHQVMAVSSHARAAAVYKSLLGILVGLIGLVEWATANHYFVTQWVWIVTWLVTSVGFLVMFPLAHGKHTPMRVYWRDLGVCSLIVAVLLLLIKTLLIGRI